MADIPVPDVGGPPASVVLGQPDFKSAQANQGRAVSERTLNSPRGIAVTPDGALFVVDKGNNRILRFASVPTVSGQAADHVLGQLDFFSSDPAVVRSRLNLPIGVAVGAGKMAITDAGSHRVLIYDQIPTDGRAEPSVVIGQPNFDSSTPACSAIGLYLPWGVAITPSGRLIVADTSNSRVLIWDQIPAEGTFNVPPTRVLGQSDTEHCTFNDDDQNREHDVETGTERLVATDRTLAFPAGVWSDDNKLVVADLANHRVLIWNSFPQDDFQPADVVLGHYTFTNTTPNSEHDAEGRLPNPTARTIVNPQGVHSDGTRLVVADSLNHRVLVWSNFPTENGQAANLVLGHSDFDRSVAIDQDGNGEPDFATARILHTPSHVQLTPDSLIVSDRLNNRILLFPIAAPQQ